MRKRPLRCACAWQWGGARNALARKANSARGWGTPTRARTRVARGGFESARTYEAVQLPARVADLDTALAKVDGDHFAHDDLGECLRTKATSVSVTSGFWLVVFWDFAAETHGFAANFSKKKLTVQCTTKRKLDLLV